MMLRYVGNPETVHFANLLIHTILFDLDVRSRKHKSWLLMTERITCGKMASFWI